MKNEQQAGTLNLENTDALQMGFWVPNRIWATAKFLIPLRKELEEKRKLGTLKALIPEMVAFKHWVTSHSVYRMWVNTMIEEANEYVHNASLKDKIEIIIDGDALYIGGYDQFFELLNEIITTSPSFNNTVMVGTPMNGLLAVSMATKSGLALFHDTTFNQEFKKVLNTWNTFLKSSDSLDKLDITQPEKPGSWISEAAKKAGVWHEMKHDPKAPGYGFNSWNSFFIREFIKGARPFHGTENDICIGCETTPWKYENNVSYETGFWVKDMPYSLLDLFGGRKELADRFTGGQIYQGFLSATHYHRWNAPLDGKLVRSWVEPGTYFAQSPSQKEGESTWQGTDSQPYLGHVATRAVFIFEHPVCGYIAMICIGMVEVSTCVILPEFLVDEGAAPVTITKGQGIGNFEFGGSTHMMIFQKDKVDLETWATNITHNENTPPTKMGTIIAKPK